MVNFPELVKHNFKKNKTFGYVHVSLLDEVRKEDLINAMRSGYIPPTHLYAVGDKVEKIEKEAVCGLDFISLVEGNLRYTLELLAIYSYFLSDEATTYKRWPFVDTSSLIDGINTITYFGAMMGKIPLLNIGEGETEPGSIELVEKNFEMKSFDYIKINLLSTLTDVFILRTKEYQITASSIGNDFVFLHPAVKNYIIEELGEKSA